MAEIVRMLKAPFPYFGGKSRIAPLIWERFGDVRNFVEPFFGSGAVLLSRPHSQKIETVNDKDSMICNFYRALRASPSDVATWADDRVDEAELHARHLWLVRNAAFNDEWRERIMTEPDFYDAKVAGRGTRNWRVRVGSVWHGRHTVDMDYRVNCAVGITAFGSAFGSARIV